MRPCLIEGILPVNGVHLMGGSPGAGKTRFTFGMIDQWQAGLSFLDHSTVPVPYTFISMDRPRDSVEETLETMGLRESITRLVCLNDLPRERNIDTVMDVARQKYPDSKMFFIEGFQLFAGDYINRYTPVSNLLTHASTICAERGETILGVCHASKIKKGAEFLKGRDRIGGSVAWSAFSETIIIVDNDENTKVRTIDIYPRNAPEEQHHMIMAKGGVLVLQPKEKGEQLYVFVIAVPEGELVTRQWVMERAAVLEISTPTADRVIKRCVDEQQLSPVSDGVYKRTYSA